MKNALQNQVIIYEGEDGQSRIDVKFEGETVWLTQAQLVELFQSSKANISEHIKNIYKEKELTPEATVRDFRTVQKEGNREVSRDIEHYNGEGVLVDSGKVSHEQALEKAEKEYRKYQVKTLSPVEKDYLEVIKATEKKLSKKLNPDLVNLPQNLLIFWTITSIQ